MNLYALGRFLMIFGAGIVAGSLITFLVSWIVDKRNEERCDKCKSTNIAYKVDENFTMICLDCGETEI